MIKVLIVDDSALMRRHLTTIFEGAGDFIVQVARNGAEAVEENNQFKPDVITLDINMPEMDGLTALSLIMSQRPVPVIMVSSLTSKGALATFEALNLGAVDYVVKRGGTISLSIDDIQQELLDKARMAVTAKAKCRVRKPLVVEERPRLQAVPEPAPRRPRDPAAKAGKVGGAVLIGVSTGGPGTLEEILPQFPADFPWPVLVAQHMPAAFTKSFSDRLNEISPMTVVEVNSPQLLESGTIYIAKGGADMAVLNRGGKMMVTSRPDSPQYFWHPSVELLGESALEHFPASQLVGVILTGMGHDGADSFAEIKRRGGRTIAESEETAIVFGMPAELIERGGANMVLPAEKIAAQVKHWVR